ncbi:Fe-S cluster assembly protein SufD [Thiosulfatimonas sediminis]|uniref:Fe-S cluster assembly protein SufD n=1 Tax=Thiosulfatimonas sediminis TaxID=2675054 RepID=A0A6F8PWM6_9GAMM|nr:Fe-S cluster assembly protein SufD [Thiosulfatimonas sediminis]BBP46531.1 Fe-S cluster assembly protein SufD [Thiosulfatimonas sediminis]
MAKKLSPVAQQARDFYLQQASRVSETENGVLKAVREQAQQAFAGQAFPTAKDEDWQYTKLTGFIQHHFSAVAASENVADKIAAYMPSFPVIKLVFVDGRFSESLSDDLSELPKGVSLESFADSLSMNSELERVFANQARVLTEPFGSLNTMLMRDGFALQVNANTALELPLFILHLQSKPDSLCTIRNAISVGENAEVTLVEHYVSVYGDGAACNNIVTEIDIAKQARVKQIIVQQQHDDSFYFNNQFVTQADNSHFDTFFASIGGMLSRQQNHLYMDGQHIENTQNSACVARKSQTVDSRTYTEHNDEHGFSRQLHKFVLDDSAVGVFNGMIRVDQQAQKTDGQMDNKNLILSNKAKMDAKPQLEIYADDVLCSHGSATGQIDDNQIFYLQARGISKAAAMQMITKAFLLEPVEEIGNPQIRQWVTAQLEIALAKTHLESA